VVPIGGSQYRAKNHNLSQGVSWSDQARPAPQPPPQKIQYEEEPVEPVQANPVEEYFNEDFEDDLNEEDAVIIDPIVIQQPEEPKGAIEIEELNSPENPEEAEVVEEPETAVVEPVEPPKIEEKKEEKPVFLESYEKNEPASPVGWSWMGSKPKDPPSLSDSTPSDSLKISNLDPELLNKTAIPQVDPPKTAETPAATTQPIPQPTVQQPWGYPNQNPYMEAGFNNGPVMNHMQAGNPMGYVVPGMVGMRPQQYQMMPIMGASPGPMMQNHMAPGLPVFNHPNPYQVNYRPVLVRNNQLGGGAPTPANNAATQGAGPQTTQSQPPNRSQSLLAYNAIPHNTVPMYNDFIQPTHKPTLNMRKQQQFKSEPPQIEEEVLARPSFNSWTEMFADIDNSGKSPGRIIRRFLTFQDLFTCFFMLNKQIHAAKTQMPLLENLEVSTFDMFRINMHLPSWNIYKHFSREQDTVQQFFSEWSPVGLREVTIETAALDDENFILLAKYLQQCPTMEVLKIAQKSDNCMNDAENAMNETSKQNLQNLLKAIHCGHLVLEGSGLQIDGTFLKILQDRIRELTVKTTSFEWNAYLISQLPSCLSGLTIRCPTMAWISLRDKLPSDLKRLYVQASTRQIENVECERLFQKLPHVQLDFSLLHSFNKPDPEIWTAIRRLDLFFDRDARPIFENIFCNLPLSLRQFSITYTGHAHNALEGWWKNLSQHTRNDLEELELKEVDMDGVEDIIHMFNECGFQKLRRMLITIHGYAARNCEERLMANLPVSCEELVVKKSETPI